MKRLLAGIIMILTSGYSFNTQNKGDLTVKITDIEKEGMVYIMLFDKREGFPADPDKAVYKKKTNPKNHEAIVVFKNLPHGVYGVAAFQDQDNDGAVNRNFLGMPSEPVGAYRFNGWSRPDFEDCTVDFKNSQQSISFTFIN